VIQETVDMEELKAVESLKLSVYIKVELHLVEQIQIGILDLNFLQTLLSY
jgi:hypothetical protein